MSVMERAIERSRSVDASAHTQALSTKAASFMTPAEGLSQISTFQQQAANRERYAAFRGWLYSAVNALASEGANQPVQVGKLKGVPAKREPGKKPPKKKSIEHVTRKMPPVAQAKAAKHEMEILDSHPILDKLEKPNDMQGKWQFTYSFIANLCLTGWAFVVGDGKEFYSIPTTWVTPQHKGKVFSHIEVRNPQEPTTEPAIFERGQFAFAYLPNPSNPFGAVSPAQSQMPAIRIDDHIQASQEAFFRNGIFPSVIVTVGKDPHPDVPGGIRPRLTAPQRRQVYAAIGKTMGSVSNYGAPAIVDGLIESIERLSATQNEMGWEKSEDKVKARILSAYCVHPYVLGEAVSVGGYAQVANIEKRYFGRINIYLGMLSEVMTAFVEGEDKEKVLVWWEQLEPKDPSVYWANIKDARQRGDISQNEFRALLNMPPDEDGQEAEIDAAQMASVVQIMQLAGGGTISPEQAVAAFKGLGISEELAEELAGDGPQAALEDATGALNGAVGALGQQQEEARTFDEGRAIGHLDPDNKAIDAVLQATEKLFLDFKCGGPGSGVPGPCPTNKPEEVKPKQPKKDDPQATDEDEEDEETGGIEVGKHVMKLTGKKEEAQAYVDYIGEIDSSFGGSLGNLLEKHPLQGITVGKVAGKSGLGAGDGDGDAQGVYNSGTKKITIQPAAKFISAALFEDGDTIAADHSLKFEDGEDGEAQREQAKGVFTHELGHHIAHTVIKNTANGQKAVYRGVIIEAFMNDEAKPSRYAGTVPHEYFAESFTAYHLAPERLSPTAKKMVQDVMKLAGGL